MPTGDLIRTILSLRELQLRQDAQNLAERQFGVNSGLAQEQALGNLQDILSNTQDPQSLKPFIPQFAQRTGFSPDALNTLIDQARPSAQTVRAGAIARGAQPDANQTDKAAYSTALTGQLPGGVQEDYLSGIINSGAARFMNGLPPEQQQRFLNGYLLKRTTGEDPNAALNAQIFEHLSPDYQKQAVLIGKGLAPSASDIEQQRLGAAHLVLSQHQFEDESAYRKAQLNLAALEANARLQGKQRDDINAAMKDLTDYQTFASRQSNTFTPEGRSEVNALMNAKIANLQRLAPEIFGQLVVGKDGKPVLGPDGRPLIQGGTVPIPFLPMGSEFTATSIPGAILQQFSKPK